MVKIHTIGKSKTWGNVYQEIGIQNIKCKENKKITGIYTTRTIGDTNTGGGTYTEE